MRFERVQVEGFGPINGFEAVFEPRRLNLIIGPNESGKSSLAAAMTATLFGFSSHEEEQRARPWEGARHRATLIFESGGGRTRVRRDFGTHEVHVERLASTGAEVESVLFQGTANPRGRGPELEQYETLLRGWFGFTDSRLFRESCFVHESSLETRISPELRHLISGAVEADYQEIQEALLDRLDALTREHPFDPRARKRTDRSIEKRLAGLELLRGRLARSEYVLRELKSNFTERNAIETRIAELKAEMATKEQLFSDLETMVRMREEQRKLMKRGTEIGVELNRARKARGRLQDIDRKIADALGYLANAPEEVESDLMRLEILRGQRSRYQKASEAERKRLEEAHPPSFPLVLLMGVAVGAALGFVGYAAFKSALAAGAAGMLGAIAGMITMRLFGRSAERGRALAEAKVRVADENMKASKQEVDAIEIRVNPFLKGKPLEEVIQDLKALREVQNERREHAAVVQSLPVPRLEAEAGEIDETVNGLRAKERFLVGQTPFLAPFKEDPVGAAEASNRLKREVTGLRTKIEAEQETLERLIRKSGGPDADAENLQALAESITEEEEGLAREQRQRDALLLALEVLRESVLDYQKEHVVRLAQSAGKTFAQLTRNKYSGVTMDGDLNPTVKHNGKRDVSVEHLSHGARDAFYFCLRAALAQELAAREPLPLVLDDPTAHFDEERRGTLLGHLETIARDIQVVLLTHDRRVLNQIREAHVLTIGTESYASDSARKIDVRR